jgi:Tfp pilus assembly protein PilE
MKTYVRRERGITLIGLVIWAVVIAFAALLVMKVFPTLNEYWTIKRAVEKIAQDNPATVLDARKAFERQQNIEYSISSIGSKDLKVTKENDKVVISFAYDKEIELIEPVFLLIKYRGEGRAK